MKKVIELVVGGFALMSLADAEPKSLHDHVFPAAPSPVLLEDATNLVRQVQILWAAHTNRIRRAERMREEAKRRRATWNRDGRPPAKPFKVKGGAE